MIIENSEIGYLPDKYAEKSTFLEGFSLAPWQVESLQKRHICLHTFTSHALGYNRIDEYNTLVISNL
jgi:hypothetical protein